MIDILNNITSKYVLNSDELADITYKATITIPKGTVLSLYEIEMEQPAMLTFRLDNPKGEAGMISELIERIKEYEIAKLEFAVKEYENILKIWEESPDEFEFKRKSCDDSIYYRIIPEYNTNHDRYYPVLTGCGSDTYYGPETYKAKLADAIKTLAKGPKAPSKASLIKELKSWDFELYANELNRISLMGNPTVNEEKPESIFKFSRDFMAYFAYKRHSGTMTKEILHRISAGDKSLYKEGQILLDCHIEFTTDRMPRNDGDIVTHYITITTPLGHEYSIEDDHCMMTGWNFSFYDTETEIVIFK